MILSPLRPATLADAERLAALEARSYPPDEAASLETLRHRLQLAPECTALYGEGKGLLGFVCSTRVSDERLTGESMHVHVPGGQSLCIHSVVIDSALRRRGHGTDMLRAYLGYVARELRGVEQVLLISKSHLVSFYKSVGFAVVGPSPVVHGVDPWLEMRLAL